VVTSVTWRSGSSVGASPTGGNTLVSEEDSTLKKRARLLISAVVALGVCSGVAAVSSDQLERVLTTAFAAVGAASSVAGLSVIRGNRRER
jgi:hypothetical protein